MAEGVVNEDSAGVAYTFLCLGEKQNPKECYEMKFEHVTDKESNIKVTAYEVPAAKSKISAADAAKDTSIGEYFKTAGRIVGETRATNSAKGWLKGR